MGLEDLSLDDIIKKNKGKSDMYSNRIKENPSFKSKRRQLRGRGSSAVGRGRPIQQIKDARLLITTRSKAKIGDARQKISAKHVTDARQKLQAKRTLNSANIRSDGKIPKVTISNDIAKKMTGSRSDIQFHITDSQRSKTTAGRKFLGTTGRSTGAKLQIAVKNERARRQSPRMEHKTFERLQITTINREAMKRKQPVHRSRDRRESISPRPSRPMLKKRAMEDSDSEFEEFLKFRKQRRTHDVEEMETESTSTRADRKSDHVDLRPMISRKLSPKQEEMEQDSSPTGPSPIEGTKLRVFNLHPVVSEDDILELFSVIGPVRRARLIKPGEAEVVYIRHENALTAYKKYNNRDLDGQPMQIKLVKAAGEGQKVFYSWMNDIKSSKKKTDIGEVTELTSGVLQQALFKGGSTGTSTRPVVFTVKI